MPNNQKVVKTGPAPAPKDAPSEAIIRAAIMRAYRIPGEDVRPVPADDLLPEEWNALNPHHAWYADGYSEFNLVIEEYQPLPKIWKWELVARVPYERDGVNYLVYRALDVQPVQVRQAAERSAQ